jgi:hypothetical protein
MWSKKSFFFLSNVYDTPRFLRQIQQTSFKSVANPPFFTAKSMFFAVFRSLSLGQRSKTCHLDGFSPSLGAGGVYQYLLLKCLCISWIISKFAIITEIWMVLILLNNKVIVI